MLAATAVAADDVALNGRRAADSGRGTDGGPLMPLPVLDTRPGGDRCAEGGRPPDGPAAVVAAPAVPGPVPPSTCRRRARTSSTHCRSSACSSVRCCSSAVCAARACLVRRRSSSSMRLSDSMTSSYRWILTCTASLLTPGPDAAAVAAAAAAAMCGTAPGMGDAPLVGTGESPATELAAMLFMLLKARPETARSSSRSEATSCSSCRACPSSAPSLCFSFLRDTFCLIRYSRSSSWHLNCALSLAHSSSCSRYIWSSLNAICCVLSSSRLSSEVFSTHSSWVRPRAVRSAAICASTSFSLFLKRRMVDASSCFRATACF
mmetsp:Transcript_22623/g.49530  ORF Transcript_22623/g.49530 Transcript_22623/m.49530 type:complete len:320 (-) Transcript_22623:359-1318(-)